MLKNIEYSDYKGIYNENDIIVALYKDNLSSESLLDNDTVQQKLEKINIRYFADLVFDSLFFEKAGRPLTPIEEFRKARDSNKKSSTFRGIPRLK